MRQFFITMAGVFAGLVLFVVGVPFLLVVMAAGAARPDATPAQSVLRLDLRDPLSDQDPQNPLAGLGRRSQSVMGIVETLRRASADSHIRGLLIRLPEGGMEPGAADEIRLAIHRFKATGKPVSRNSSRPPNISGTKFWAMNSMITSSRRWRAARRARQVLPRASLRHSC